MSSYTVSGARAVFRINGKKVAWATNVSYTITHEHLPVNVLDKLEVEEYSETAYYVTFSAGRFRVPNYSPMGAESGLQPKLADILTQPELTAVIYDKTSETTLLTVYRVKMIERSGAVGARDLATETYNFVGVTAGDEGCLQDPGTSTNEGIGS